MATIIQTGENSFIAGDQRLTDRQIDGYACIRCGDEPIRMIPVGFGPRGQLFECATHDR